MILRVGDVVEIGIDAKGGTCGGMRRADVVTWHLIGPIIRIEADTKDGRAAIVAGGSRFTPEALRRKRKAVKR